MKIKPKKKLKTLSTLYTANLNNEVIAFGTNLKDFIVTLNMLEIKTVRTYEYYYKEFRTNKKISLLDGEHAYILQEVFNF